MTNPHSLASVSAILDAHGHQLDDTKQEKLQHYVELLLEWNSKINLISRKDQDQVWRNHVLHSLAVLLVADVPRTGRVIDIGSGGGLPGIPLSIMRPETEWVLVDSVGKKIRAVGEMATVLDLPNVLTVYGRVEDDAFVREFGASADMVTARAVTRLEALVRWARALLTESGSRTLIVWKGGDLSDELAEARRNPTVAGCREIPIVIPEEPMFVSEEKKLVEIVYS